MASEINKARKEKKKGDNHRLRKFNKVLDKAIAEKKKEDEAKKKVFVGMRKRKSSVKKKKGTKKRKSVFAIPTAFETNRSRH